MRFNPMKKPKKGPWILSASSMYCEQEGTCLHDGFRKGDIAYLYSHTGRERRNENILLASPIMR